MASCSKRSRAAALKPFSVSEEIEAIITASSSFIPTQSKPVTVLNNQGEPNGLGTTVGSTESEKKTPAKITVDSDFYSLFCDPKSTKKTSTTGKRKLRNKTPTSTNGDSFNCSNTPLYEMIPDEPGTSFRINTPEVENPLEKFMEIDPHASIWRFFPRKLDTYDDERPVTLFSPEKGVTCSAPHARFPPRREPKEKPNQTESWERPAISAARRTLLGCNSPLFEKRLDARAYSHCSPLGKPLSRFNATASPFGNESTSYSPGCSTPLPHAGDQFKTPSAPSGHRGFTRNGEPLLSGVKALFNDGVSLLADESPISLSNTPARSLNYTPARSLNYTPARSLNYTPAGITALASDCYAPANSDDDEAKSTILFGVTCYVEVRFNKGDRGECVKIELTSLGAKVEKNFTKKVTHVVFKAGKISTYMKAKELKIPIVSLLWIKACKTVGGLVDPALYAPTDDVVYQKNMPIAEEKRRERFLRRGQEFLDRLNGLLPPKPPRTRSNKKKGVSVTEEKKEAKGSRAKRKKVEAKGPKKLNFKDDNPNRNIDKKSSESDSDYVSETDSDEKPTKDNGRRKSAPADLGDDVTGQQKLTTFFQPVVGSSNDDGASLLRTPSKHTEKTNQGDLLKVLTGGFVATDKKRRKLFDPNESLMLSQALPGTPVETSPYIKVTPPSKKSRSQTTSSKRNKRVPEKKRPATARKSLAPLMEQEEDASPSKSTSSRNSLACFILEKKSKNAVPKCQPKIAFTSIAKDELAKYKDIIRKLGVFDIDSNVSRRTTHLVTPSPARRTVNLLKALARGCWILDVEWLTHSEANGKWMSEEPFELKSFSAAVTACRLERQAFGKEYAMDLFSSCGPIFVDSSVQPPRLDLIELLKLCCGKVVSISSSAQVIISDRPHPDSNPEVTLVSPKWILDSITQNKRLPLDQYRI